MSIGNKYKIYSLSEPGDEKVRYIGLTGCTLEHRLGRHLYEKKKNHRCNWIKSLSERGLIPEISLVEDGLTKEEAIAKEIHYIKMFKSFGAKLVNGTIGGEGGMGHTVSDEAKERMRQARKRRVGWKHNEESKRKISEHHIGHGNPFFGKRHSEDTKAKISLSGKGRMNHPNITDEDVLNIRRIYSQGLYGCASLASIYGVSSSTIERIVKGQTHPELPMVSYKRIKRIKNISEEDVVAMRKAYSKGGQTYEKLAAQYNVHHSVIERIIKRITWKEAA